MFTKIQFIFVTMLATFLVVFFIITPSINAQTSRTIVISPPKIEKELKPGEKIEGVLSLINESNEEISFTANVYDFIVVGNQGTVNVLPRGTIINNRYSASNWVAVDPPSFRVKPRQRVRLNYYIQIPSDAAPGGHYAAIVYQPIGTHAISGSGATISTQIATLLYISVPGPINQFAKVISFLAPLFQEYGPVGITTEIKNLGDLHITPSGTIKVIDLFGRTAETSPLESLNIFPGGISRVYQNTVGQQIMIGRFKASLLASYGKNNNLPLVATVYFWVFPWKIVLVAVLAIIAVILSVLYWRKREKRIDTDKKQINADSSSKQAS